MVACPLLDRFGFSLCLCIFVTCVTSGQGDDAASDITADIWDEIFQLRSDDEWRNLWHVEKHRRCYQDLENHMRWVCDKDIYKMNKKQSRDHRQVKRNHEQLAGPFLTKEEAYSLLGSGRAQRRAKRGIMDECCHGVTTGCSWEEYAEYCQHHSRTRT
ncbi:putative insulin-like peptide 7 [Halotydeus destructor]|nr:putative insulin-like peptide 7 [Halotydeus destructor]